MSNYKVTPNMPVNEYNAIKAVRNSRMKEFVKCPRRYQYFTQNESPRTAAMEFGTMFHVFIFEPDEFAKRYVMIDEEKRPDKAHGMTAQRNEAWAEEIKRKAELKGGGVYTNAELSKMELMKASILENPVTAQMLADEGEHELTVEWDHTAEFWDELNGFPIMQTIRMKARIDKLIPRSALGRRVIVDLKTAVDGDPDIFDRHAWSMDYHRAAALYSDALDVEDFYLIVVEKTAPYIACAYLMDETLIQKGRIDEQTGYVPILKGIAKCRHVYGSEFDEKSYPWPGYEWKANSDGDLILKAPLYK